jgi:serine/threonine protein kinase
VLKKLGKYELIEEVGRGAMGSVYKAHDPSIGRLVALKTISTSLVGNADLLERFYREAQSAGGLQHPNIVTIYELGQEGETPFIAMEFLEGQSLENLIDHRTNLSVSQKVGLILPVVRALEFAHARGVVHRDVKPANVMLTKDGTIKVVDFGIARIADMSKTRTDVLIGTIAYMAPQQIHGQRADVRSDIWALGVTFYELLCFRRPFDGENAAALMLNTIGATPIPLRDLVPDCPPALERIVEKMLQKHVADRFQTMEEIRFELEPLWKNMQEASISNLIADAEAAIHGHDLPRARDVLRKALEIDSGHGRVKPLLEQVNTEIRRIQNRAQIEKALERARELLKQGRYLEAKAEVEGALELDSNFIPARELLGTAKQAAETARLLQENLQAAKQRFAEDALAEAAKRVEKVLALDPGHTEARTLQRRIRERLTRREEQARREDLLSRARKFWGEQQLDDCIRLLADGHKEFPADPEIAKALEAAREDLAEQKKQQNLAEARMLAADRRFDEALVLIERLLERSADPAVRKLYSYIRQEKEALARRQTLERELVGIQSLINEGKFAEAVSKSEKLLQEFPDEGEAERLSRSARNELEQVERRRQIDEALQAIQRKMQSRKFQDAIDAAEKALIRAPGNPDLEAILGEARSRQKEKEASELLHKRIGEIQRIISRGQHTDAVDLARQTLSTLGPNAEVAQLLRAAEMELEQKRKKREEQERQLAEAQSLLQQDRFEEADELLRGAIESHLLPRKDVRVRQLLNEIEQRRAAASAAAAELRSQVTNYPAPSGPQVEAPSVQIDVGTSVVQQTPPVPEQPSAVDSVQVALSATVVVDNQLQSNPLPTGGVSDTPYQSEQSPVAEQSPVDVNLPATSEVFRADEEAIPSPRVFVNIFHERRLVVMGIALGVLVLIGVPVLILHARNQAEIALRDRARELEKSKNWPEALIQYEGLALRKGRLAAIGNEGATRLRGLIGQEELAMNQANDAEAKGNISLATELYRQAASLEGDKERQARDAVERLNALTPPVEPARQKFAQERKKTSSPEPAKALEPQAKCELLPSDIPIYIRMADDNRANGKYADAEREYNAIIQCEPQNEPAVEGLRRARVAQSLPHRIGN